jgi:SNF-related kinase
VASPEVFRKYDKQRKRLTPIQQRSNNYSSSDTSDTDETDPTRRRKLKQRFHRRDSSDHSSDTDGPATPGGASRPRSLGGSSSGTRSTSSSSKKSESKSSKSNKESESRKGSKENKYACNGHVEALNEENKACTLIHVRSKDFTDLMDKFSTSNQENNACIKNELKLRQKKSRDKLKVDINRNGLVSAMPSDAPPVPATAVIKTKCCSVI